MRILILGGGGFVGGYLKTFLSSYGTVLTASRSNPEVDLFFDINKPETYSACDDHFDVIIDCMVDYSSSINEKLQNEVVSKSRLLEFISHKKIHYVDISSVSALNENRLLSDYNFSKFLSDEVTQYVGSRNNLKYTILRFAQIFDREEKGSKTQKALYYFINAFRKQQPLTVFGNPDNKRSYIPVEILVKTVYKAIAEGITGVHNVIMPDRYSANDLIAEFSRIVNYPKSNILYQPEVFSIEYYIPSCSQHFINFMQVQPGCVPFFSHLLLKNEV
jgi:nucleoside-diphosphate-sugar epimerase